MSSVVPGLLVLAVVLATSASGRAEEERLDESLVRVNIIKTTKAASVEAAPIGRGAVKNYRPDVIQVFHSAGVVVDDRSHVATFLGYGWVDVQGGGDLRIELVVGADAADRKLRGKLIGIDQSTGVAVVRALEGTLKRSPLCVQCALRDGTTVVTPVLEEDGWAQLERSRVLGVGSAESIAWGAWQLKINRRLPSLGVPLLDTQHRVLGFVASQVAPAPAGDAQTIVFPISQILTSASRIIETGRDICTGWLGIYLDDTALPKIRIARVAPDGPAFRAGLESEDVLVQWNGSSIRDARQFIRMVQESAVGSKVQLGIMRRGKSTNITTMIGTRVPEVNRGAFVVKFPEVVTFADPSVRPGAADPRLPRLGADIVSLTPQLAEFLEIPVQAGLLVSSVHPRMPAALAGLQAGDVIVAIDGQRILEPSAFIAHVQSRAPGSTIVLRYLRRKAEHDARIHLRGPAEQTTKK